MLSFKFKNLVIRVKVFIFIKLKKGDNMVFCGNEKFSFKLKFLRKKYIVLVNVRVIIDKCRSNFFWIFICLELREMV